MLISKEIQNSILNKAAQFQFESCETISTYHAFLMGTGEIEAELLVDIDWPITKEIDEEITKRVKDLSEEYGMIDKIYDSPYRGEKIKIKIGGEVKEAVILNLLSKNKVLVESYSPIRHEFELSEDEWQSCEDWNDPLKRKF